MADETELVRLLRLFETTYEQTRGMPWIGTVRPEQAFKRAADTIEALQRERDAMREALEKIAAWSAADDARGTVAYMLYEQLTGIARAALSGEAS